MIIELVHNELLYSVILRIFRWHCVTYLKSLNIHRISSLTLSSLFLMWHFMLMNIPDPPIRYGVLDRDFSGRLREGFEIDGIKNVMGEAGLGWVL